MKTLYLHLFSGISGDMFIGAMLDLGIAFSEFEAELKKINLDGYHLHAARQIRSGIEGVKFDVHLAHEHKHAHEPGPLHSHSHSHSPQNFALHGLSHTHELGEHEHEHGRNFADIKKLISQSALSNWVKEKSTAVFHRIAVAEGKIHGHPPDEVHFHEVGAVDSIIDIIGACIALEFLGKPRIFSSPVIEGTGWINCAHGKFPIPAPATLEILSKRNVSITQCDEPNELVTPTGAALLAEFVEEFTPLKNFSAGKIGYGIGTRENKTQPNVLRAVLGEILSENSETKNDWETDSIAVLETNLDDINGEILGHFVERALADGALDVFHTSVQMKKNRPGILLTILCASSDADKFSEMILRETTAFGVRRTLSERRKLRREFKEIETSFGKVEMKIGTLNGEIIQAAPEFESCRKIVQEKSVPIKIVYSEALKRFGQNNESKL